AAVWQGLRFRSSSAWFSLPSRTGERRHYRRFESIRVRNRSQQRHETFEVPEATMSNAISPKPTISRGSRWTGRAIGAWVVLFLAFDAGVKVLNASVAVEGTTRLGYPEHLVVILGIIELVSLIVYVWPRTATVGATLLTAYLGGATATQVRVEDPWFALPVVVGVLVWGALWLRDSRVRSLLLRNA